MPEETAMVAIAHSFQLAVAPVLISVSITLSTVTALLVAAVIALLFISAFLSFDATVPVALTFTAAMLAFVVALLAFLREVLLATTNLRFGPHADA